ncbi:MAG: hypothetical protein ACE366_07320 [Bradymonadia bacterium]
MSWTLTQSPRCMRGLHFFYRLDPPRPTSDLVEALSPLWPQACRVDEPWPGGAVVRLTVPHVLELRIGERPGEVSLYHRSRTSLELRAQIHQRVEQALDQLEAPDESVPRL